MPTVSRSLVNFQEYLGDFRFHELLQVSSRPNKSGRPDPHGVLTSQNALPENSVIGPLTKFVINVRSSLKRIRYCISYD